MMAEITIERVEEILLLTPEQFERFLPDLIQWYRLAGPLARDGLLDAAALVWCDDGKVEVSSFEIEETHVRPCCRQCATPMQLMSWMILCPTCGNKRYPKAANHANECSGSNEPGQVGAI